MSKVTTKTRLTAGVCRICTTTGNRLLDFKTGPVHPECFRMQRKGLLWTGSPRPIKDSTGKLCGACHQTIESAHAHRGGVPFHRECLT